MFNKMVLRVLALIPLVLILFAVSLVGENHRARGLAESYLDNVMSGSLTDTCIDLKMEDSAHEREQPRSCEDQNFLFLLALMTSLDIRQNSEISFDAEIEKYWTPFSRSNHVAVSVSFQGKGVSHQHSVLFLIYRHGWSWGIDEVQVADQNLRRLYSSYQELDLDRYMAIESDKLELKHHILQGENLSFQQKMLLKYNMQQLRARLDKP